MFDTFKKVMTDAGGSFQIDYYYDGKLNRANINQDKPIYLDWLLLPVDPEVPEVLNTPEVIAFVPAPTPAAPTFNENKATRIQQIDFHTANLLAEGAEYPSGSGKKFSLTMENLVDYTGILSMNKEGLLPPNFPLRDNKRNKHLLVDSSEVSLFFATMSARISFVRVDGNQLKDDIEAATTQTALDAIVDTRV